MFVDHNSVHIWLDVLQSNRYASPCSVGNNISADSSVVLKIFQILMKNKARSYVSNISVFSFSWDKISEVRVSAFTIIRRIMTRVQLFYINVLGSISVDLLMCQSWNFK